MASRRNETSAHQPIEEQRQGATSAHIKPKSYFWTVPNALCVLRLVCAPVLIVLAIAERRELFLAAYAGLALTDWLDGKLAILLNQRSTIGPRLDTISDATMYGCLLAGIVWLEPTFIRSESYWVATALGSYVLTVAIALCKFHRWPSYHTRAAKFSSFLVALAAVSVVLHWSPWLFRIAATVLTLTNLETALMSLLLDRRLSDVPTIYHALRRGHD